MSFWLRLSNRFLPIDVGAAEKARVGAELDAPRVNEMVKEARELAGELRAHTESNGFVEKIEAMYGHNAHDRKGLP